MAGNAFIKIGDLKGESQDSDHDGYIDVISWNWGMTNFANTLGGGLAVGKPIVHEFSFTKLCDISSPDLARKLLVGEPHATVSFELYKSSGNSKALQYLWIRFEEVLLTAINFGGSGADSGNFMENVSFAFKRYTFVYTKQTADGAGGEAATYGYDVAAQQEC